MLVGISTFLLGLNGETCPCCVLGLLESGNCVGWHWFRYQDNDPTAKGADPSNLDSNKGLVDNEYNLYKPLADAMKELNINAYRLADWFDQQSTNNK